MDRLFALDTDGILEYVMRVLEWVKGKLYNMFYEAPYLGAVLDKIPAWAYGVIILVVLGVTAFIAYHVFESMKRRAVHAVSQSKLGEIAEKRRTAKYAEDLVGKGAYVEAADVYMNTGQPERAAQALIKGNMLGRAGKIYEKMGQIDKAIELYEKGNENSWLAEALKSKGEHGKAGDLFMRLGKKLLAAEAYVKANRHADAAKLFHESGNVASAAECYEKAGQFKLAAQMYEQAYIEGTSSQEIPSPEIMQRLNVMINKAADYYEKTGDQIKAAATYLRTKQYVKAGEAALKGGDVRRAAEYFKEGKAYDKAAEVFTKAGNAQMAAEILAQKYIDVHDYVQAGMQFKEAGIFLKAADMFGQAGELVMAGDAFMSAGEFGSAAELYQEAGEKAKAAEGYERAGNLAKAAELHVELGGTDKASFLVEQAGDYALAAQLYRKLGKSEKELSSLQKVRQDDPRYNEAMARLGELFMEQGNLKLAEDKYNQTIGGQEPNLSNIPLYYGLGRLHETKGEGEKALDIYRKVQLVDYGFRDISERVKACESAPPAPPQARPAPPAAPAQAAPAQPSDQTQDAAKRYAIVKEIGRGGMGVVYQARDKHLNRVIAIKVLPKHISDNPKMIKRFAVEARSAAQLTHANIVTLHDFQQAGGRSFITMEYVDGMTLKKLMGEVDRLPVIRVLKIVYQCCQGLDYAHKKGIVHRDIKPSNIMVNKDDVVKIMDFGLAKVAGEESLTDAGSLSGTVMYMSPEQLLGEKLDARTDIYSLGVMFYELITGRHPFSDGDAAYHHIHTKPVPPKGLRPDIPDNLDAIILRCLEKDRAVRFESAAQLAMALREVPLRKGQ